MNGLEASKVLSPREIHLIQVFTNGIGRSARRRSFANLTESPLGITMVHLGFFDGLTGPVFIGSLRVLTEKGERYSISVRRPNNVPITPQDEYPDVVSALVAAHPYAQHFAMSNSKAAGPTFLAMLRRVTGL